MDGVYVDVIEIRSVVELFPPRKNWSEESTILIPSFFNLLNGFKRI